jgi:competence protein ComEA
MWAEIRVSRVALGVSLLLWAAVLAADNPPPREDPGKKLVEEICSFCHGLARLRGQAYTRDQWSNVVKGMVSEGAPVTDEEFSLILDYLAKNFGPPAEQGKEEK